MAKIELQHVSFCYGKRGGCFRALDDLNLTIESGEFICLLGQSGCGKTTLLRLLAGLQMPTQGVITMDGKPITGPGTDRAMVFQNYTLFPWMTAQKNVQFGIRQAQKQLGRTAANELAMEYLSKVHMAGAANKYPYQLSGGMRQRVAIARALAMDADILLLDEPFGALDAKIRADLQALLEELWCSKEAKTVIFVTHDIAEAALLASRILFMTPGKIRDSIPVDLPRPRSSPAVTPQREQFQQALLAQFYQHGGVHETST